MSQGSATAAKGAAIIIALALAAGGGYWAGHRGSGGSTAPVAAAGAPARTILYYRNPMGLPDTSPVPKKDGMGMDYVPVYEGDEVAPAAAQLKVSLGQGPETGRQDRGRGAPDADAGNPCRRHRVQADERKVQVIAPKFEGFIERLLVNQTGQPVKPRPALMEFYSPDLVLGPAGIRARPRRARQAWRRRHAEAREGRHALSWPKAALSRLRNWDISAAQIDRLRNGGEPTRTLTLSSPDERAWSWRSTPSRACASCRARCSTRSPTCRTCG